MMRSQQPWIVGWTRSLEESNDDDGNNNDLIGGNDAEVLKQTLRLYGSFFLVVFSVYCVLRQRYPRLFMVRRWAPMVRTSLADDRFGLIDWVWKVWEINNDQILENCGMDALCYLRVLRLGFRLSCVGLFNSIWLFPVYASAEDSDETEHITDRLILVSVTNVPPGSPRFMATVLAAYVLFGVTMALILMEFEWFTRNRHSFLSRLEPRHYSVLLKNIPDGQTSGDIMRFFRHLYPNAVLTAHVALKIPNLEQKYAERESLLLQLEHLIAVRNQSENRSSGGGLNLTNLIPGLEQSDPIEYLTEKLSKLNVEIAAAVERLNENRRPKLARDRTNVMSLLSTTLPNYENEESATKELSRGREDGDPSAPLIGASSDDIKESAGLEHDADTTSDPLATQSSTLFGATLGAINRNTINAINVVKGTVTSTATTTAKTAVSLTSNAVNITTNVSNQIVETAGGLTEGAISLLSRDEDGALRDAAFVTFTKLSAVHNVLQTVQHSSPFVFDVEPAPNPSEIFWSNIGKPVSRVQLGTLLSIALSTILCLFWTVPVTFIVSLTEVDSLKQSIPFLDRWIAAAPWLQNALALVAPVLILILNSILPVIVKAISRFECHVADSNLEASAFSKQAVFVIVQTFFVSAISGTITSEITNILNKPELLIDLLANSLPAESTYFIQIIVVATFVGLTMELLRLFPLFQAGLRGIFGFGLTKKERSYTMYGLHPLSDPDKFYFSRVFAGDILYFMVLFVYSTLAPIVNWFVAGCLLLMGSCYRHQFIFNYPKTPDSGGKLWISFIGILQSCMLIAQITILGFFGLRKATIAGPFMFPLIIATVLFNLYVRQRHFWVAQHLPAYDCLRIDLLRQEEDEARRMNHWSQWEKVYLQPSLKSADFVQPDWEHGIPNSSDESDGDVEPPSNAHAAGTIRQSVFDDENV